MSSGRKREKGGNRRRWERGGRRKKEEKGGEGWRDDIGEEGKVGGGRGGNGKEEELRRRKGKGGRRWERRQKRKGRRGESAKEREKKREGNLFLSERKGLSVEFSLVRGIYMSLFSVCCSSETNVIRQISEVFREASVFLREFMQPRLV